MFSLPLMDVWKRCSLLRRWPSFEAAPTFFDDPDLLLLKQDSSCVLASEALAPYTYVCLYFSAHWCPPCRAFTPVLKTFYETHHEKKDFAVVFLTWDDSEEDMLAYFHDAHADYFCVPWDQAVPLREELGELYNVHAIPTLLVFENATEEAPRQLLSVHGRDHVQEDPDAVEFPWEDEQPPTPDPDCE